MHLQINNKPLFFTYSVTMSLLSGIRTQHEILGVPQRLLMYKVKGRMNACHHNHLTKGSSPFHNQCILTKVSKERVSFMSLNRVEVEVVHSHIEPTGRAKNGYVFRDETQEVGPSNINIAECAGFCMKKFLKHII